MLVITRSNLFLCLSASNKSVFVMGDFNINLLGVQKRSYAHNFLLSSQRFSFFPTIDKPTRVHNNSAALIDNILLNRFDYNITSGNIVSDVSDHDSQFCILTGKQKLIFPISVGIAMCKITQIDLSSLFITSYTKL